MPTLSIDTRKAPEAVDITGHVRERVAHAGVTNGVCHLLALHTTVGLTVMDLDPARTSTCWTHCGR